MGPEIYGGITAEMKSQRKSLFIASTNQGKIKEFRQFFSHLPINIYTQPETISVNETGGSFSENAHIKALEVARITGEWALADDSGLSVLALNGAPGIHSARYESSDERRVKRLLNELEAATTRTATFIAVICIASPDNLILLEVEGRCEGIITKEPVGEFGFGYDPVFEVNGTGLTFAQMDIQEKGYVILNSM